MFLYKATHTLTLEIKNDYFLTEIEANTFAEENKVEYPVWTIIPLSNLNKLITETDNNEEAFDELEHIKLDEEKENDLP